MADTVEQLWKDQTLQEKLYPITKESAVVDDNDVSLDTKIASKLEGVKINGTALTVTNKTVNIPVASANTLGVVTVDSEVTSGSNNPVRNSAVKNYVDSSLDSKMNIVASPTAGDIATVNSSGQVVDSGHTIAELENVIETVKVNGVAVPVTNKSVDITVTSTVDNVMSDTSTNAVQNKTIKQYIDDLIASHYAIAG